MMYTALCVLLRHLSWEQALTHAIIQEALRYILFVRTKICGVSAELVLEEG
jgi:hypothetical protein